MEEQATVEDQLPLYTGTVAEMTDQASGLDLEQVWICQAYSGL